jgi:Ca-activated chloride channel homolog
MNLEHKILAGLGSLAAAAMLVGGGCADMSLAGDVGVTPGGSQDIRYARDLIAAGQIPAAEHFTAEGLFSEHDLPLDGEECGQTLCPRAAASWTDPVGDIGPEMLIQLGFGTNVTADNFQRRPLNLALAVDISGSMGSGDKMPSTREALHTMVDQLDSGDRMALVAFDDTATLLQARTVMDAAGRAAMHNTIDGLGPQGGTCIECGMQKAYDQVAPHAGDGDIEDRVMLFTDAQPNVGATGLNSFLGMARYYAEADIGLSAFGVGLDLGSELVSELTKVRGGNAFYLADADAIAKIFDEEFDFIVSPIAYDLQVQVDAGEAMEFAAAYGAPLDDPAPEIDFGASTLFLSKRKGGIGVTLRHADGGPFYNDTPAPGLATFHMTYETIEGDIKEDTVEVSYEGGATIVEQWVPADDLGVYKMSVLLDEYLALMAGARFCQGVLPQQEAEGQVKDAQKRLLAVSNHLTDAPLQAEVALMEQLLTNVQGGSGNCAPEDYYYY